MTKEKPEIVSYEPEGDPEFPKLTALPARKALAAFQKGRARLIRRLENLQSAQWHRAGRHVEFPHYDVHFAMDYMAHHEAHHIYQMFQRRPPLAKAQH